MSGRQADDAGEQNWSDWIGRERVSEDVLDLGRARAMQATLDRSGYRLETGDPLPPLWHWMYFWELAPTAGLGADGHPRRDEFLPPIPLPRRMWAGSRVRFLADLPLGAPVLRRSVISDVAVKEGRSGRLAFVTIRHTIEEGGSIALEDEHDIVYREPSEAGDAARLPRPAPADPDWSRELWPDPVLLFRYSALTFNGHRIHYDRPYATEEEGYPGLVVHGPLLATLMMEDARQVFPGECVTAFWFRALGPVFDTAKFLVAGRRPENSADAEVWVARPDGGMAMNGSVGFADGGGRAA